MNYETLAIIGAGLLALQASSTTPKSNKMNKREGAPLEEGPLSNIINSRLNDFISDEYGISFKYPASWNKNPRYENKYEGASGFFEVSGFEGASNNIDEAVQEQINEPYLPYGTNPTIRRLTIDGQPAREIIPSEDQGELITDRDVALVVQYRTPIIINGVPYQYLIIWTTRDNLPLIIRSLKFIQNTAQNPEV